MSEDDTISKVISNNIKAERIRNNLTQEETAKKLGITTRTYLKYEKDASKISATSLLMLSQIFKCSIDAFYLNVKFTK